jgi:hypothetical protein
LEKPVFLSEKFLRSSICLRKSEEKESCSGLSKSLKALEDSAIISKEDFNPDLASLAILSDKAMSFRALDFSLITLA